ncbi:MAG: XdhC family protein [Saccharospirillum sp.]
MTTRVTDMESLLQRATELRQAGQAFAMVTVVRSEDSTSAKAGAKALVESNGVIQGWIGGGCAQPAVLKTVQQSLTDGEPRLIRISPGKDSPEAEGVRVFGMSCYSGGTLDIFIEPVLARPGLLILGTSPVARTLAALASQVGFTVSCAGPGADRSDWPGVQHQQDDFDLTTLPAQSSRFVVVATQGKKDQAGLEAALSTGSEYIAFVASDRKAARMKQWLLEQGYSADQVEALNTPAGIEIGARTPEEIALSVLAALVQARRGESVGEARAQVKPAAPGKTAAATACCASKSPDAVGGA